MKLKKFLLVLLLSPVLLRLHGQSPEYQFSTLNFTNGLSNNHITSLYKDPRGFMWFGTMTGLNRYDGYEFKIFRHDQRDPHSIGDNFIEQIFEGPEGKMWVQSRSSRFNIYDLATDQFDHDYAGYLRKHALPEFWLLSISRGASGYWFIYRDSGVYHLNFDGKTTAVHQDPSRPGCLAASSITDAKEDHFGNFWVIHQNGLLEKVDGRTHTVTFRTSELEKVVGNNQAPCGIYIDGQNDLWVFSSGYFKGVWCYHPATGAFTHFTAASCPATTMSIPSSSSSYSSSSPYSSSASASSPPPPSPSPPASFTSRASPVSAAPPNPGSSPTIPPANTRGRLSSDIVYNALQDDNGKIWLATDHGGVDILDKNDFSVTTLAHIEDDRKSLAENSIPAMIRDSAGTIWLGTFKSGISYYHQHGPEFPLFRHHPHDPQSLSFDDVNKFAEDSAGNLWIGSNGGGLLYFDRRHNIFRQYLNDPGNPNSLTNNIIVSLLIDHENRLWIGTYFGGLDYFDGKHFIHYRHDDRQPSSLADDRVMSLYEDASHTLWAGTLAGGLDRFDRKHNRFEHFKSSQPNSIQNNYVSSITEDIEHNLWIATAYGIDVMDRRNGRFTHYSSENNQLSTDNVILLFRDTRNNMWAGTRDGLNLFLPEKNSFQSFNTDNGLPDNTIRSIIEDRQHDLWVSTANGISRINITAQGDRPGGPVRIRCRNYHEKDGLQGREFNERTALATRDGSLIFGGPNGFNLFRPEYITNATNPPPIVLTGLDIFNKNVTVGEKLGNHIILDRSLTETHEITLSHSDDIFSIEFAALDFIDNSGDKYAYTLEGFNNNWLVTDGKARKATYTNLDAGTYTFRVRASDEDGQWYDREASLKIVVLPPFWKTPLAYVVYALLLIGILVIARRMVIRKARARFALEQERRETKRLHEIDLMKIRFFTNMSHELRTPLSLILAPVEKLLAGNTPPAEPYTLLPQAPVETAFPVPPSSGPRSFSIPAPSGPQSRPCLPQSDPRQQYEMIRRNARRLLHLVNQLLDFRKMEVNELRLQPRQGDILQFIHDISRSFIDLAERKNITFSYQSDNNALLTSFDYDKIERILFNLLSNAFKFTPANGAVNVTVSTEQSGSKTILSIRVQDTGIGIAPDVRDKIFERFFQSEVPNTILNQGSGIGLSITNEFVRMHHGQLFVESELNKGSCFTVRLPFIPIATPTLPPPPSSPVPHPMNGHSSDIQPPATVNGYVPKADYKPAGDKLPAILIVEDNEDFRFYLKDNLRHYYTIIEAADGREGWRKALAEHPDLIVSDISMPAMNGMELCRKIADDERTAQIPVILLTAMTGEGAELNGLRTGAIDYIIKPFNFELLLSKIRNVLTHTASILKTYQRQVQAAPAALEIESADEIFVRNVLEEIEKNIGNPEFSVGELGNHFHASRSTFYKRLLLLTGKTPIEFIRHIRLKRAAELLEKSQLTVAEIAYTVGFNNPKNFSQYFKEEFNRIPSTYRSEKKGSQV